MNVVQTLQVNPKRLDEVFKGTKFFRKLLSFYRPLNQQFSEMRKSNEVCFVSSLPVKENCKYVPVILHVFDLLFNHQEGIRLIEEHRFFPELGDCLMQVVQVFLAFLWKLIT